MKNIALSLILIVFFSSCKSKSSIITTKIEAEKKGIYSLPQSKKVIAKNDKTTKPSVPKSIKKSKLNEKNEDDYVVSDDDTSYLVKQLINTAAANLGANYKSGGTTSEGYDCSGLMFTTFKKFDIILPRSSVDMAKIGEKISGDAIKKGDLIFFKTNGRNVINHVGMVIEITDDEIKFIHSSTQKGVIISSTKEPYYEKSFTQVNRIL